MLYLKTKRKKLFINLLKIVKQKLLMQTWKQSRGDNDRNSPQNSRTHVDRILPKNNTINADHINSRPVKRDTNHVRPSYGTFSISLPHRHYPVTVRGERFYYSNNVFYQKARHGFLVVRPPIGSIVVSLPLGNRSVLVGGLSYFFCNDVYYQRVPSGYLVVKPPCDTVVVREQVQETGMIGQEIQVTAALLNMRTGPGLNYSVIDEIPYGHTLIIREYKPEWLYVQTLSGECGWVMEKFTS